MMLLIVFTCPLCPLFVCPDGLFLFLFGVFPLQGHQLIGLADFMVDLIDQLV